jgi:hypothetical protein
METSNVPGRVLPQTYDVPIDDFRRDREQQRSDIELLSAFRRATEFLEKFDQPARDVVAQLVEATQKAIRSTRRKLKLKKAEKHPPIEEVNVFGVTVFNPEAVLGDIEWARRENLLNSDFISVMRSEEKREPRKTVSSEDWLKVFLDFQKNNPGDVIAPDRAWTVDGYRYEFRIFFKYSDQRQDMIAAMRRKFKAIGVPTTKAEMEKSLTFVGPLSYKKYKAALMQWRRENASAEMTPETTFDFEGITYDLGARDQAYHDPESTYVLNTKDLRSWNDYAYDRRKIVSPGNEGRTLER